MNSPSTRPSSSNYQPSPARRAALAEVLARFPGGVPRPEYPRPRLVRGGGASWQCLNGAWEFSYDYADAEGSGIGTLERWQDKTLPDFCVVPFAPQWPLSAKHERGVYEWAWYAREFDVPAVWLEGGEVLLHFGACDYRTTVWVNDLEVGHNQGGHVPFSLEISSLLQAGTNRVVVRAHDPQDPRQPRGKQAVSGRPEGCDYWCTTGIWQSVWLESVPATRIEEVVVVPRVGARSEDDALEVTVYLHAPALGWRVEIELFDGLLDDGLPPSLVTRVEGEAAGAVARLHISLPNGRRWSPQAPHLYGIRVRLVEADGSGEAALDEVRSYAGLRSVALRDGMFHLNGKPLFLQMVLDQGYWPDGGLTAPTDEALRRDVELTLELGFNGARKHQKVEDPRWLYHCDRMGLLVWGEMANARAWSATAEEWFLGEWERVVRRDVSHPCIVAWVPHNESWGMPHLEGDHPAQHAFMERTMSVTRRLDPSRPVISNDGWEHSDLTDIVAIHDYQTGDKLRAHWAETLAGGGLPVRTWASDKRIFTRNGRHAGQPVMLTEIGGFLNIPNLPPEQWDDLYNLYNTARTPEELEAKYRDLMETLATFGFVSGWCYTQLTDVEQEINGLLSYDRVPKLATERIRSIHEETLAAWQAARQAVAPEVR